MNVLERVSDMYGNKIGWAWKCPTCGKGGPVFYVADEASRDLMFHRFSDSCQGISPERLYGEDKTNGQVTG